ncbi:deoxynucleoside kinase [Litorivivens sp.]|uniref:deoxynucleoside kinase n=1 Tax=Litorivivens sp. TaxID=2020868 RepID=UPI003569FAEE
MSENKPLPAFIAVEGPIGVGKTTLTNKLADHLGYQTVLERADENPFLERFYKNRRQAALATQLYFLFQRAQQLDEFKQSDLFKPTKVADFLMQKDRLFARANLDSDEMALYEKVYNQLTLDAPVPDLVIYLQAPADVLMNRIQNRGIRYEQRVERRYLEEINEIYSEFFLYYEDSPLLIVNASEIDFANNPRDFQQLLDYIPRIHSGRHYFNPSLV